MLWANVFADLSGWVIWDTGLDWDGDGPLSCSFWLFSSTFANFLFFCESNPGGFFPPLMGHRVI